MRMLDESLPPGDLPVHANDGPELLLPGPLPADPPQPGGGGPGLRSRSEFSTLIGPATTRVVSH